VSGANRRVIRPWQACRAAPISVAKGARLHLSGRVDLRQGHRWLWAANDAGAEGWVPLSCLDEA